MAGLMQTFVVVFFLPLVSSMSVGKTKLLFLIVSLFTQPKYLLSFRLFLFVNQSVKSS